MSRFTHYALAFIAIEALLTAILLAWHHEQDEHRLSIHQAEQKAAYEAILTSTRRLTDLAFESRVTTPENLALLRQAHPQDADRAAVARGLLYRRLYPLYQDMRRNHVRQMHVHLPGGVSFLRMHRPEQFGDALYPYRPIIRQVNETRERAAGFETGRVTHGFRFAYPVLDGDRLLATFEFSISFTALRKEMERLAALPDTHYQFIVRREAVEPKLFEGRETLYRNSRVNDQYLVEDPASSLRNESTPHQLPEMLGQLDAHLAGMPSVRKRMSAGETFGRFVRDSGNSHAVNFLPVESATGNHVGYILAYTPTPEHDTLVTVTALIWLGATALLLLTFMTHYRLQKSRHFMTTIAENMGAGLYVTDSRGRITFANATTSALLGFSRHELHGRKAHDMFHANDAHSATEAQQECPLERVVKAGALFASDDETFRTARGELRDVEVISTPLELGGGERGAVTVFRDVTERKQSDEKLKQVVTALRNSREGVMITDRELTILDVNEAFTVVTGWTRKEILGHTPRVLQSGHQGPDFYQAMWRTLTEEDSWRGEIWNRRKDGSVYPEWLTISAIRNEDDDVTHYVAIFSDITELHQANQRLETLAHEDSLTGLANRHALERHLDNLTRKQAPFAVLFIDLDHFKRVNDTMGHAKGDRLLREMADRLRHRLRSQDMLGRLGGDEFVAVLKGTEAEEDAARVARKLIEEVARPYRLDENELSIGASIGVARFPENGETASTLLRNADTAMYQAKAEGRNNYHFYTTELTRAVTERMKIESLLSRAIDNDELSVQYQPQVDLASGHIVGAEALLRWDSPDGPLSPADFIPVAEQTGQITALGRWVLNEACRQLRDWQQRGIGGLRIAVNLSAQQLSSPQLLEDVDDAIRQAGVSADQIELEITETAVMQDPTHAIETLRALRERGVKLAIDDFGTGYSSLNYLKQLPIDYLKIDQSFVRGIPGDADDVAIVDAIIALARSLNLVTIAEGVETREQYDELRRRGCDTFQGYLFSKSLSSAAFERLVRKD